MKLSGAAKKMIVVIGISFAVISAAGFVAQALYFPEFQPLPFAIGVLLGCMLSALKVILLDRTVSKALTLEAADAKNYIGIQVFARFILTGVVLATAAINDYVSLWGTAVGILTLQVAAVSIRNYKDVDEQAISQINESNEIKG